MLASIAAVVAMFEPATELYPWAPRGIAARLRRRAIDRLHGLPSTVRSICAEGSWHLKTCRATGFGDNPLSETCEIILTRSQ
jgi:hypothetical protein